MVNVPAFSLPLSTSSFTGSKRIAPTAPLCSVRPARSVRPLISMADENKGLFSNPFAKKPDQQSQPTSAFIEPQPGDPGYIEPPVVKAPAPPKAEATPEAPAPPKPKSAPKDKGVVAKVAGAVKLPVAVGENPIVKRGLDLLKEDVLKNAPEVAGVGRQDIGAVTMKPTAGEPGFKPQAFQTVNVSELGISPFPDDKNAVGKVGGLDAVKKAAVDVKKGKSASEIKKQVLNIKTPDAPTVFDIPDYLKPLPEDTVRKGRTWKNYQGR